jgi:IS30 family transposase
MSYRRVTYEDRLAIKSFLDMGLNQSQIAFNLGFHKSTISREISRNTGGRGYRCKQAQRLTEERQLFRQKPVKMNTPMIKRVESLLHQLWSPEQIAERMHYEGADWVSYETIYQHVYSDFVDGGNLYQNLRFSHRKRKPRFPRKNKDRRGVIPNTTCIEKRMNGANNRSREGHWERDLMLGKSRSRNILMHVDRKNRYVKLTKLGDKIATKVAQASRKALRWLPKKSITNDRGWEFSAHKSLSQQLKIPIYFCHPYTSSERGTVENRIGVLRQYIPKGTDLRNISDEQLQEIEDELNSRPMKCLGWRTPYEVTFRETVALTS